jgi:hypothetical protein
MATLDERMDVEAELETEKHDARVVLDPQLAMRELEAQGTSPSLSLSLIIIIIISLFHILLLNLTHLSLSLLCVAAVHREVDTANATAVKAKEKAIADLSQLYSKHDKAKEMRQLIADVRPFLGVVSKVRLGPSPAGPLTDISTILASRRPKVASSSRT